MYLQNSALIYAWYHHSMIAVARWRLVSFRVSGGRFPGSALTDVYVQNCLLIPCSHESKSNRSLHSVMAMRCAC